MEINLIEFKQSFESSTNATNRNQEPKNKDFVSTLDSVTNNSKVDNKETKTTEKEEIEQIEDEFVKKDKKVSFEGMINLLNITPENHKDSEVIEVELTGNIIESDTIISETNEKHTENLLDGMFSKSIISNEQNRGNEETKEVNSKEIGLENIINLDNKGNQEELKVKNTPVEEKSLYKTEENQSVIEENNLIDTKQPIIKEGFSEFDRENQGNETKSGKQYELTRLADNEEDLEITNDSFVPFTKDGIRLISENSVELEVPVTIEPKEIVEQIVEKVKFDLSESKNEIKLSLKPEALGEMTMNIEVAKDGVIAKLMVDNYRTKEIIEGNLIQLKEGIKETGLEIKTFEVFVGNGSDFDKHNSSHFNLKQNSKKMKIKAENNKVIGNYEDGTIEDNISSHNHYSEGGLNLLA